MLKVILLAALCSATGAQPSILLPPGSRSSNSGRTMPSFLAAMLHSITVPTTTTPTTTTTTTTASTTKFVPTEKHNPYLAMATRGTNDTDGNYTQGVVSVPAWVVALLGPNLHDNPYLEMGSQSGAAAPAWATRPADQNETEASNPYLQIGSLGDHKVPQWVLGLASYANNPYAQLGSQAGITLPPWVGLIESQNETDAASDSPYVRLGSLADQKLPPWVVMMLSENNDTASSDSQQDQNVPSWVLQMMQQNETATRSPQIRIGSLEGHTIPPWVRQLASQYDSDDGPRNPNEQMGDGVTMPPWVVAMLSAEKQRQAGGDDDQEAVPLQPNFEQTAYLGLWYEIYRHKLIPFESGTDNTATYTEKEDGSIGVVNREWLPHSKEWTVAKGTAKPVGPARLTVKFGEDAPPGDYRVLHTDYNGISLVYSKSSFFGFTAEYAWILARSPDISDEQADEAFEIFEKRTGLVRDDFHKTMHGIAGKTVVQADSDKDDGVTISGADKCTYQVPSLTCPYYIGEQIVYDMKSGACGVQSNGCDRAAVEAFAFKTKEECFDTCIFKTLQ